MCVCVNFILSSLSKRLYGLPCRLQTNSSCYTWLPLGYITSECKSLNSLMKYCKE